MHFFRMIRGALCAAPFLLAACGGSDSKFDLVLQHHDCEAPAEDLFPTSGMIEIEVTGDGMGTISSTASLSARTLEVPEIPNGSNRVATVRVYDQGAGAAKGGLRTIGRSAPFSVSDSDTASVVVLMNRVNGFTKTRDASGSCASLGAPRAGHTATQLKDGRVLLAGGFRSLTAGKETDVTDSAEVFDPATGAFSSAGKMCVDGTCLPRAHGQAALLRDGQVLITGGIDGSGNPTGSAVLYDPDRNSWTVVKAMDHARRGHTATLLVATGSVIVVGGVDEAGSVVGAVEVYNPSTKEFAPARDSAQKPLLLARAYHAAANVGSSSDAIQVVGGIDGEGKVVVGTPAVKWNQGVGSYQVVSTTTDLATGVLGAGLAVFRDRLAAIGGASKWSSDGAAGNGKGSDPVKLIQWFDRPGGANVTGTIDGLLSRINPCVAVLDGDRALVLGGFAANGMALSKAEVVGWAAGRTDPAERVLQTSYTENLGKLRDDGGRGWATCTDLGEGRVLVAGGIGQNGSAVSSAEIYVAAPLPK